MPLPVVRLANVSWTYARAASPALSCASVEIGEGELVAVMGAAGAGKSSLLRLLNGLIPHSLPGRLSGKVEIDGEDTRASSVARLAEKVGMAFDDPEAQFFTARVADEVAFALENMEVPPLEIARRCERALRAAGLMELAGRAPATLSGGQKQRLAIAAAAAMANRVLALDDPCAHLDPAGAREVLSFVSDLRAGGRLAVVMATGSPEEAARFADRVCVLKEGRILALDTPSRVFSSPRLLAEAGIDAPEARDLAFRMKALGHALPRLPLTEDEAAGAVLEWWEEAEARGHPAGEGRAPATAAPSPRRLTVASPPLPPGPRPSIPSPLKIENLRYAYGASPARDAVSGFSLTVGEGEFVAILGQNGSGKTTLLKCVAGLLRPRSGRILARGRDAGLMSVAEIAGEVGYVMQDIDGQLFAETVWDEVAFALRARGLAAAEVERAVEEALRTLGLLDLRGAFPLALGKADRVKTVFAATIAMGARTLMLDEPLAGQDSRGARAVLDTLERLRAEGRAIVLVTHNVRAAAERAQRIVAMKDGHARVEGSPAEVLEREEELAEAGLLLPTAARLSKGLRSRIPLGRVAASCAELAGELANLASPGKGREG